MVPGQLISLMQVVMQDISLINLASIRTLYLVYSFI